jgi:hypothetical protein
MIRTFPIAAASNCLLTLAAATLLSAFSAQAALVAPGTPFNPGVPIGAGTTIAVTGSLFGTVLADQTIPFAELNPDGGPEGPFFTGTLRSVVVQRADTSTLDFYYQVINTTPSELFPGDAEIFALAVENFDGFGFAPNDAVDLIFRTDGLSGLLSAPAFVNGTAAAFTGYREAMTGGSVGFQFANDPAAPLFNPTNLKMGETSNFLVVRTTASQFGIAPTLVFGNFGTAITQAYAPVPEPAAATLLAAGALALGLRRRRATR